MTDASNAKFIEVKLIRGGSSKGVFVHEKSLPGPGQERDQQVLKLFGTPDVRQIDGLGGGDKLTSKFAVMGPPSRSDCDISYLFAQVGTEFPDLDWRSNCGNISSGAALFAAIEGVGQDRNGHRYVAIEQANTGRRLLASIPLSDGAPATTGDFVIGGVPGAGPRIDLDFADFGGSSLNMGLFPTGRRQENLVMPNGGSISITVIDMANLNVILRADDLEVDLTCPLDQLQNDGALVDQLDHIRATVMIDLGQATLQNAAEVIRRSVNPLVHILAPPQDYKDLSGVQIGAQTHDVLARSYARRAFSKAYPGTGAIGTAVAMCIIGTNAYTFGQNSADATDLRIGHPGGCLGVSAQVQETATGIRIERAMIGRTARVLMEGRAYLT